LFIQAADAFIPIMDLKENNEYVDSVSSNALIVEKKKTSYFSRTNWYRKR